jgi:hypothetical protein
MDKTTLFSPIKHNSIFNMYIITDTYFGLFYRPSYIDTYICNCVLCNVLPDDGLQKRPKHVAVIIYILNILLCLMGENISSKQRHKVMIFTKLGTKLIYCTHSCIVLNADCLSVLII